MTKATTNYCMQSSQKTSSIINCTTHSDAKNVMNSLINNKWYSHRRNLNTKLNKIKNNTNLWITNPKNNRKKEIIIHRLRIGHT